MRYCWNILHKSWLHIMPHRMIIRALMLFWAVATNVQSQNMQLELLYARERYNLNFLRSIELNLEPEKTEELL